MAFTSSSATGLAEALVLREAVAARTRKDHVVEQGNTDDCPCGAKLPRQLGIGVTRIGQATWMIMDNDRRVGSFAHQGPEYVARAGVHLVDASHTGDEMDDHTMKRVEPEHVQLFLLESNEAPSKTTVDVRGAADGRAANERLIDGAPSQLERGLESAGSQHAEPGRASELGNSGLCHPHRATDFSQDLLSAHDGVAASNETGDQLSVGQRGSANGVHTQQRSGRAAGSESVHHASRSARSMPRARRRSVKDLRATRQLEWPAAGRRCPAIGRVPPRIGLAVALVLIAAMSAVPDRRAPARAQTSVPPQLVLVPAGPFRMGGGEETDEQPGHVVTVAAFFLDRDEVTRSEYQRCVTAGACRAPTGDTAAPEVPVTGVSWFDARDFCRFAGKRLPTEAEWEKAARTSDGRIYPWGNELSCGRANFGNYQGEGRCPENPGRPVAVGSYPSGNSAYGVRDMAGNVWEWVADHYDPHYYRRSPASNPRGPSRGEKRVLRGGACCSMFGTPRAGNRLAFPPWYRDIDIGFRCARDAS